MKRIALALVCLASASCLAVKPITTAVAHHEIDRPLIGCRFESAPLPMSAAPPVLPDGGPALCADADAGAECRVEWDSYPGRVRLTINFPPFPATCPPPSDVHVWLSFDEIGGGAAEASGDLAHVSLDPATSSVTIYNATEQDYYVRVVVD